MRTFCLVAGVVLSNLVSSTVFGQDVRFTVLGNGKLPLEHVVIAGGAKGSLQPADEVIMDQLNVQFVPYVLPVHQGDNVEFPNSDQIRHHVYSFSEANSFELKLYHGAPGAAIPFDKTGAVVLGCNIHDNMVGYVFVTDRPFYTSSNKTGHAALKAVSDVTEIDVWHPALSLDSQKSLTFSLTELSRQSDGTYLIELDVDEQPEDPQAVMPASSDRFRQFIRD